MSLKKFNNSTAVHRVAIFCILVQLILLANSTLIKSDDKQKNDGLKRQKRDLQGLPKDEDDLLLPVETNDLIEAPKVKEVKKKAVKKRKSKKRKVSRRKHISKVPPPMFPLLVGELPLNLAEDDKHSGDAGSVDEAIEAQKEAFEAILEENHKNPKRSKEFHEESYINLKYDYKTRKYTITEEED